MVSGSGTGTGASPGAAVIADADVKATLSRNGWIAKLRHVKQVTYGLVGGTVTIVVFVDKAENIGEVSRQVPSRIEGYPVDVEEVHVINPLSNEGVDPAPSFQLPQRAVFENQATMALQHNLDVGIAIASAFPI